MREAFYRLGTHRGRVVAGQQIEQRDRAHEQRGRGGGLVLDEFEEHADVGHEVDRLGHGQRRPRLEQPEERTWLG